MATSKSQDDIRRANYASIFLSASMTAVTHPIQMTKVMIQIGFEPVEPTPYKNLFGKQMYKLPGLFTYASIIYQRDGTLGLFRGVTPRIFAATLNSTINNSMLQMFHSNDQNDDVDQTSKSDMDIVEFAKETCYQSISRATSTIVTYPFQVVSIRMIAQFVGKETKYTGIIQSVREIYSEEGISGLFAGLLPHLIGDLVTLWIFRGLTYCVNRAVSSEIGDFKDLKVYTQQASHIIVSSMTYPFVLVANLMAVNKCRFEGTSKLPTFDGWTDCWGTLRKHHLLWRGSSIFRRTSNTNIAGPLTLRKSL
ncbi:mitochondrial carrier homolog 2-like [Dendronephthya gigantea]|uniref:mitochondrial carrier homolog 2-like n=1 Tax=Dendronephthya gigantea TaxID=151771 RepID=UPI00106D2C2C|nr:mitochondrial carrier homolog 2-like [Dendronephthya gigantea]